MLAGATTEWRVAQGITDQMELLAAALRRKEGKPLPDLSLLSDRIRKRLDEWCRSDPASVESYNGEAPSIMWKEVRAMS
jgi:hypothetical protein